MTENNERAIYDARRVLTGLESEIKTRITQLEKEMGVIKPTLRDNKDPAPSYQFGLLRGEHRTLLSIAKTLRKATVHIGNWDDTNFKVKRN